MPVVARGRYVEIATTRDEAVCEGTVRFMDHFIAEGFALVGETPPERRFVRYEWEDADNDVHRSVTRRAGDGVRVRSSELIHEHELAHAVHLEAWPSSAQFLHEGFAVLLDPYRPVGAGSWRDEAALDAILESTRLSESEYYDAWFLVSQIVADHGSAGLKQLWYAVPHGATAQEVRAAYDQLFGRPIDALIEPWVLESDSPEFDGMEMSRSACTFALCIGETRAWAGDMWSAPGPTGCEHDPQAVGPYRSSNQTGPPVWRSYVFDPEGEPFEQDPSNEDVWAAAYLCGLNCSGSAYDYGQGPAPVEAWRDDRRRRIQVHSELEELPTNEPAEVRFHRTQ